MKLIRIVKLARVKYGDLDEGDRWKMDCDQYKCVMIKGSIPVDEVEDELVMAYDTTKYPPEDESYSWEGIPADRMIFHADKIVIRPSQVVFDESEIETRYV